MGRFVTQKEIHFLNVHYFWVHAQKLTEKNKLQSLSIAIFAAWWTASQKGYLNKNAMLERRYLCQRIISWYLQYLKFLWSNMFNF